MPDCTERPEMTIMTSGSLLYGYDLGGGDEPWRFTTTPSGDLGHPAWYDPTEPDHDFAHQAHRHLLASIGVPTDDELDGDDFLELLVEHAGVHIERYSWERAPSFVLTAHETTAYYDQPTALDPLELDRRRTHENWETRLADAIRLLGLVPDVPAPRWLLISSP
ncbi:MAG: hypothetical protein QOF58_3992 [Pseudonocardiales bacterium]|jgi:hypothetical protein|nr:hypothetical protein [Pseudonocardiales bacterium]